MMLILLLVLHAVPVQAQNRVGNGGDVVLCTEAVGAGQAAGAATKIRDAHLLDFYESEHVRITPPATADYEAIISERLAALRKKDESLGEQYLRRWEGMKKELAFKEGIALAEVEDSGHVFTPAEKNCSLRQIALRKSVVTPGEPRFLVNKTYWDRLAPADRAGLILHEIIYEHFFKLGEKTSVKARGFNARLFAKCFETDSVDDYWKFVSGLKVPLYRK